MNKWKCFVLVKWARVGLEYYTDRLGQINHLGKSIEMK